MNCQHCGSELRQHGPEAGGSKAGAWHCDGCGCCFLDEGKTPRPGVPLCAVGRKLEPYEDYADMPVAELREYAEGHGVDLSGASRKDEIVERIEAAPAPVEETTPAAPETTTTRPRRSRA